MLDLAVVFFNLYHFRVGVEGQVEYFDALVGEPTQIVHIVRRNEHSLP